MKKEKINISNNDFEISNDDTIQSDNSIGKIEWETTLTSHNRQQIEEIVIKKIDEKFNNTIEELRNNLFTLFSILASVIAFLFAEIQILKSLCYRQSITGFTLILLWSLSVFVILIKLLLNKDENFGRKNIYSTKSGVLLILSAVFIIFWVVLSSQWHELKCENEAIIQQYQENLYDELDVKIEKKIKKELNNIFSR